MSLFDAFIGGVADQSVDFANQKIKEESSRAMAQFNSDLDIQKARTIEQLKVDMANAPLNRVSTLAKQKLSEQVPQEAAPVTTATGQDPMLSQNTGGMEGVSGMSGKYADLVAKAKDLPAEDQQPYLDQLKRQFGADQGAAQAAVAGKTRARTSDEAFGAALDDAKINDPVAYAAGRPLAADKTISVPDGGTILDSRTGKVIFSGTGKMDRQMDLERFKAEQDEKKRAASENMKWLELDPMGLNPANPHVLTSGGSQGAGGSTSQALANGANGDDLLKTLPIGTANQVKALASGKEPFPGGMALKTPYWQSMMTLVSQYDPTFDAVNYNKRNQTAIAFSKGKQADAVRAVNQTIYHMGSLYDAIDNLSNFSGVMRPLNYVKNPLEENLSDSSTQGVFRQKVQAVSSELRKVFSGSGGGNLTELKEWQESFPLNATPKQQKAYLNSALELLHGGIEALDSQYKSGMGPIADVTSLLSKGAQKTLDRLQGGQPESGPQPAQQKAAPTSTQDYSSLWN